MTYNPKSPSPTRRELLAGGVAVGAFSMMPQHAMAAVARPRVTIETGVVEGYRDGKVAAFKGIPYGGPVEGAGRWKRADKPKRMNGVFKADRYGPRAIQTDQDNLRIVNQEILDILLLGAPPREEWAPTGENCLTLNVWTPVIDRGAKLPVMVWMHGGGFVAEVPPLWWNDGAALAKSGEVVIVTVRHRIGALGYLDLAQFGAADLPDAANIGQLDLVLALEWVRDNISEFGGDAGNVTIFGESGGGGKVSTLLGMPSAKGLFHKAIIQSGPGLRGAEQDEAKQIVTNLMAAAGVKELAELRSLSAEKLALAQSMATARPGSPMFRPTVDGAVLPRHPFDPVAPDYAADVPVLIGTNKHEMSLLLSSMPGAFDLDRAQLAGVGGMMMGPAAGSLIDGYSKLYPDASPSQLLFLIMSDRAMRVPSITLAERKSAQKRAPTYMYLLEYETDILGGKLGSPHGLDLPFVFNRPELGLAGTSPNRFALAQQMSGAWINFAKTGHPAQKSLPTWRPYTAEDRATMIFDVEPKLEVDPGKEARLLQGAGQPML